MTYDNNVSLLKEKDLSSECTDTLPTIKSKILAKNFTKDSFEIVYNNSEFCTFQLFIDIIKDYKIIRSELYKYGKGLDKKQEILVLTKIDLLNKEDYDEKINLLKSYTRKSIYAISIKNKKTIDKLVLNLLKKRFEKNHIEEEKWTPLKKN